MIDNRPQIAIRFAEPTPPLSGLTKCVNNSNKNLVPALAHAHYQAQPTRNQALRVSGPIAHAQVQLRRHLLSLLQHQHDTTRRHNSRLDRPSARQTLSKTLQERQRSSKKGLSNVTLPHATIDLDEGSERRRCLSTALHPRIVTATYSAHIDRYRQIYPGCGSKPSRPRRHKGLP